MQSNGAIYIAAILKTAVLTLFLQYLTNGKIMMGECTIHSPRIPLYNYKHNSNCLNLQALQIITAKTIALVSSRFLKAMHLPYQYNIPFILKLFTTRAG